MLSSVRYAFAVNSFASLPITEDCSESAALDKAWIWRICPNHFAPGATRLPMSQNTGLFSVRRPREVSHSPVVRSSFQPGPPDVARFSLEIADSRCHSQLLRHPAAGVGGQAVKLKYRLAQPAIYFSACALHVDQPQYGATSAARLPTVIFGEQFGRPGHVDGSQVCLEHRLRELEHQPPEPCAWQPVWSTDSWLSQYTKEEQHLLATFQQWTIVPSVLLHPTAGAGRGPKRAAAVERQDISSANGTRTAGLSNTQQL